MTVWTILLSIGLPSAIVGGIVTFALNRIEKKLEAERRAREKQEEARKDYELFQVKTLTAVIALSKANALALKNGKCNGETTAALKYLERVKHEQRDFLTAQGIEHLF